MKHTKRGALLIFLLASLMLASNALAQTAKDQNTVSEDNSPGNVAIVSARSACADNAKAEDTPGSADHGNADDGVGLNLAQLSSRRPPVPPRPHRGYPPESYQDHWMDQGSARHGLIGALIGFGVGAALAAKADKTGHPGAMIVLVGGAGGLIGAAVGANHGGPGPFARHRRIDPPSGREGKESDLSADSGGRHSDDKSTPPRASLSSERLTLP